MVTAEQLRQRAIHWPKGRYFDDFAIGQVFEHHWGRTISEADSVLFTSLTLSYTPRYVNVTHARELGHTGLVVNPMLVFLVVFGLSVEDLSEVGGAFLGVDDLVHHRALTTGDTVTARSTVTRMRQSRSRPDSGIVTWHTEGHDQHGQLVIDFHRTNLLPSRRTDS